MTTPNSPEVTMTTSTIHHRPAPFIAAAAVAAIAAVAVGVSLTHHHDQPSAPGQQNQTTVQQDLPRGHHFQPTTSGGRVMLGP
jgi:negative regulator of sigma E activity